MKITNRYKFIAVFYRKSEQFNVIIISYIELLTYVQRQIDNILRKFRVFARVYVNNIVIFNKTLKKHLQHLRSVFQLFQKMNIALKLIKIYLNYSIVTLLNQKINNLKLIIVEKKLKAIFKLRFSITLKLLKIYLKFIE